MNKSRKDPGLAGVFIFGWVESGDPSRTRSDGPQSSDQSPDQDGLKLSS